MKKTLALALAVIMICVCALTVSAAETTLPDVTFGGWWTAHSQGVQITEEGFTMTFTADTEDGAALNYCVPTLVIHAGAADAVGAEYWCQRADAWGWLYGENVGDHADALHAKGYSWNFVFEDSFISWENFQATTEAGTQATVTAKLEGSNVQLTYKLAGVINEVTIPVDAANPVYLCITGERCAASNIVVTTPDAEPTVDLKVSVWTKDGAWVTADELAAIKAGFEAHLAAKGYDVAALNIVYEETVTEGNKVADLGAAVNAAGDFDIIIGCGKNVSTTGAVEAIEKATVPTAYIAAERYVARLTENALALELYTYLSTEPAPVEPDPSVPTEPETQPTEPSVPETQPTEPSIPETEATQPEATEPATKPANPGTGDNSPVMLAAVMMMAAACLIVLVQKKRAF